MPRIEGKPPSVGAAEARRPFSGRFGVYSAPHFVKVFDVTREAIWGCFPSVPLPPGRQIAQDPAFAVMCVRNNEGRFVNTDHELTSDRVGWRLGITTRLPDGLATRAQYAAVAIRHLEIPVLDCWRFPTTAKLSPAPSTVEFERHRESVERQIDVVEAFFGRIPPRLAARIANDPEAKAMVALAGMR